MLPFWNGDIYFCAIVYWKYIMFKNYFKGFMSGSQLRNFFEFQTRFWTSVFWPMLELVNLRDSERGTKNILHYEMAVNFKDRWNVWVWKRLVWVSSWEGVDLWWFISIVSFIGLRNTWGISEAWLWVCPKRINYRGTTCPECRCHPSDGLGKRIKPAKPQHSPFSASWLWAQCDQPLHFPVTKSSLSKRDCTFANHMSKAIFPTVSCFLLGIGHGNEPGLIGSFLRMPDLFYKQRNWCSTE